jgi:thioredoxin-related protein
MRIPVFLLFICPFLASAQKSIHFEEGLTWQELKDRAKAENKFIFVDCFATWCGPCKLMDENVYSNDSVVNVVNESFVSVKVQCDTSKSDNGKIKSWYSDAHFISNEYNINSYPTFLFLTPDGKIVHEAIGYQKPQSFVNLCQDALNPGKQYFTLLQSYRDGNRDYSKMPYLASTSWKLKDSKLALSIAADYKDNYLYNLSDEAFCTKNNLDFITAYPQNITSKDKILNWCLLHPTFVDSAINSEGFSRRLVSYVINKEKSAVFRSKAKERGKSPDWAKLSREIRYEFGATYVERNILIAKIDWYKGVEDWKNYTKYLIAKLEYDTIEKSPKTRAGFVRLNDNAWEVFEHSENKAELEKAITWTNLAIDIDSKDGIPVDTKANLLYKLGRTDEALKLEAKAAQLSPNNTEIQQAYKKMLEGKPTW